MNVVTVVCGGFGGGGGLEQVGPQEPIELAEIALLTGESEDPFLGRYI